MHPVPFLLLPRPFSWGYPAERPAMSAKSMLFARRWRDRGEWRIIPIASSMRWRIELHIPCINSSGLVWLYNCPCIS